MGTNSVWIGLEEPEKALLAYNWHCGFGSANQHISVREWAEFKGLADSWRIIAAKDSGGDYIGLSYFEYREPDWVIGGLMVARNFHGCGLGLVITCLTLGHILLFENPLARNERVVAYVANSNTKPLFLADKLAFRRIGQIAARRMRIDAQQIETSERGTVEYEITVPDTLHALAQWCTSWNGELLGHTTVDIELHSDLTLKSWYDFLISMADLHASDHPPLA